MMQGLPAAPGQQASHHCAAPRARLAGSYQIQVPAPPQPSSAVHDTRDELQQQLRGDAPPEPGSGALPASGSPAVHGCMGQAAAAAAAASGCCLERPCWGRSRCNKCQGSGPCSTASRQQPRSPACAHGLARCASCVLPYQHCRSSAQQRHTCCQAGSAVPPCTPGPPRHEFRVQASGFGLVY